MNQDLSSFISNFQQENPNLFDFVHRTVHQVETTCTEENAKPNRLSAMTEIMGRNSAMSTSLDMSISKMKPRHTLNTRLYSTEASTGRTAHFDH